MLDPKAHAEVAARQGGESVGHVPPLVACSFATRLKIVPRVARLFAVLLPDRRRSLNCGCARDLLGQPFIPLVVRGAFETRVELRRLTCGVEWNGRWDGPMNGPIDR